MILINARDHLSIFGNGFFPQKLLDILQIPFHIFKIKSDSIAEDVENEILKKCVLQHKNIDSFHEEVKNTLALYVIDLDDPNNGICISVFLQNEYSSKDKLFNMFERVVANGIFV